MTKTPDWVRRVQELNRQIRQTHSDRATLAAEKRAVLQAVAEQIPQAEIARLLGVTPARISQILKETKEPA